MSYLLLCPIRSHDERTLYIYKQYFLMFKKIDTDCLVIYDLNKNNLKKLMPITDGLLLVGGRDINAKYFYQENHPSCRFELPEIDILEFELIDYFFKNEKPIFGICRGIQTLNVYFGGTLIQDIPSANLSHICHQQNNKNKYCHTVKIVENTELSKYLKSGNLVNSFHHQCIDKLGKNLTINAYSEDGLIEGIENELVFAIQWHPEKINDEVQTCILELIRNRLSRLSILE